MASQVIQPASSAEPAVSTTSKAVKGPALASTSHTLQLVVMLTFNTLLILFSLYFLPMHLLWRKAMKYHIGAADGGSSTLGTLAYDSLTRSKALDQSAARNIVAAFQILFGSPQSDRLIVEWMQDVLLSTLAPLVLAQGWFVARFKGWFDEAEAMERGDRDEVLSRRRIGLFKKMEDTAMTTFALPIVMAIVYACLVLCGAPAWENRLQTVTLAVYVAILAGFPVITALGTDEPEYIKAFSQSEKFRARRQNSPRLVLLSHMATWSILGALIGSAGLLLDWEKAWQVYPVPVVFGAGLGAMMGNVVGGLAYLSHVPLRRKRGGGPRVEKPAPNFFSSSKRGSKKNR